MPALAPADLDGYKAFMHRMADAAREVTLPRFRQPIEVSNKSSRKAFDPVTEADREAEAVIRRMIRETYPDHGIVGEEHGREGDVTGLHWQIDPIDGTRSFIAGVPLWGTLIALNDGGGPVLGLMDQPFTGERFTGGPMGAARNGEAIGTRATGRLEDAILMTTDPFLMNEAERAAFLAIMRSCRITRFGTDCYGYCLVAAGMADLVIEAGLHSYDIQPLVPILRAAGGIVTDWQGGAPDAGGRIIAAGDARLHAQAVERLARVP